MKLEACYTRYSIEIAHDDFVALEDSESYVTDNAAFKPGQQTLSEKLNALPDVSDVDYNGHFGAAVYLTMAVDVDTDFVFLSIKRIITAHLKWCKSLPIAPHVAKRRKEAR
jgi:hypothetical protein